jgi:catechol 2,3-dioxygenase-like lactoylglutathione lyase family enzyme
MEIQELALGIRHVADQQAFYCTTLGLPLLTKTSDSFTVQAGRTRLTFQESERDVSSYHIAFTIPRQLFSEAKAWVQKRLPLLQKNGQDEIFFANLNARSFYFCDPAGNILEYIVHYHLNDERERADDTIPVLHVSEIGLPVEDVPAFADQLFKQCALEPYGGAISEHFAFLGDIFGQAVVVKVGRPWLPTETVQAAVAPVHLTIKGQREQKVQFWPYPYTFTVTLS